MLSWEIMFKYFGTEKMKLPANNSLRKCNTIQRNKAILAVEVINY